MSQNEKNQNNAPFVSGVMLGGLLGSAGLYLFGTKKGRDVVKKLLDMCENLEDVIADHEKDQKHKKNGEHSVVSDVENLMSKLQSILPDSSQK
jgi:gas vesicle protein